MTRVGDSHFPNSNFGRRRRNQTVGRGLCRFPLARSLGVPILGFRAAFLLLPVSFASLWASTKSGVFVRTTMRLYARLRARLGDYSGLKSR